MLFPCFSADKTWVFDQSELALLRCISNGLFKRRAIATSTAFQTCLSRIWEGNDGQ